MSAGFWDERYAAPEYAYGTEPSALLSEHLAKLRPGDILLPAEGEGRNAVHAARTGWNVTAFDQSTEGRRKALALAARHQVTIDYRLDGLDRFPYPPHAYNAVASIFVHLPPSFRPDYHRSLVRTLRPDGTLIIEAFSKEQIAYASGGPKDPSQLYSVAELQDDLNGMRIILLEERQVVLNEGPFHSGPASVIHCIARKEH
ncbi:MAG: methyltransferase domain-containing protein [Bacteroidetes bacterium]|nr:methyltransferase domain-containing protein [Bacteroidota bacterium]